MMPSQKCFKTHEPAVAQANDRLIMKRKLVSFDSIAKVHFELYRFKELGPHVLCENRRAVVVFLRKMHGNVGVAKDLFRCVVFRVGRRYTDIQVDRDSVVAQGKRLRKAPIDAAGNLLGLLDGREITQYDGEFVSADPRHSIRRIQRSSEPFGRDDQNAVARTVAERVVDVFEAADVDEKYLIYQ